MSNLVRKDQLLEIQKLVEIDVETWGEHMREASLRLHYRRYTQSQSQRDAAESANTTEDPVIELMLVK